MLSVGASANVTTWYGTFDCQWTVFLAALWTWNYLGEIRVGTWTLVGSWL